MPSSGHLHSFLRDLLTYLPGGHTTKALLSVSTKNQLMLLEGLTQVEMWSQNRQPILQRIAKAALTVILISTVMLELMAQSKLERTARGGIMRYGSLPKAQWLGSPAPLGVLWRRLWAHPGYQRSPGAPPPAKADHSPKGQSPGDEICLWHWTVLSWSLRNITTIFGKKQWRPRHTGKDSEWSQSSKACILASA